MRGDNSQNSFRTRTKLNSMLKQAYKISAEVFFNEGPGSSQSVFGSDRKYWSQRIKTALGLIGVAGFPFQLSLLKTKKTFPIPAVDFTEAAPSLAKIFSEEKRIYATPDEFFVAKFRNIFQQTRCKHTAPAEAKTWLRGPNMKYWPQQVNFAVFCATHGCKISRGIFDSGFSLTPKGFHLSALGQCSFLLLSDCKISCLPPPTF